MKRLLLGVWMLSTPACADPCEPDEMEGNDDETHVSDLGAISDAENTVELDLTLHDTDDVDWFTFAVIDQGIDGNPDVSIGLDGDGGEYELTVAFRCSGDPTAFFSCSGADTQGGCIARGPSPSLRFGYDCEGGLFDSTDNGSVTLSVRRLDAPEACASYGLTIAVD